MIQSSPFEDKIPFHREMIHEIRDYYITANTPHVHKGYEILFLPDSLLSWLVSVLHDNPLPAPRPDVPWNDLIISLQNHRIHSILSYRLLGKPDICHPPKQWKQVIDSSHSHGLSWFRTIAQIAHLDRLFRDKGIDYVLLKGPALAWQVYPHPSLRESIDIDILIDGHDIQAVTTCLCEKGYSVRFESSKVSEHIFHHQVFFPDPMCGTKTIEVHWRPLFLPRATGSITVSDLLSRRIFIHTEIGDIPVLSLPDSLMLAATHMCIGHPDELRLIWIQDIDLISSYINQKNNWEEVLNVAQDWQGVLSLKRAMEQASLWIGTKSPPFKAGWPDPSSDEIRLFVHVDRKISGESLNLHEQFREMPNIREKLKVLIYCMSASSEINKTYSSQSLVTKIRAWWNIVKIQNPHDADSIRKLLHAISAWVVGIIRMIFKNK
ncbi:MAG: hypothetical protein BWY05_01128 [Euryarchaeota archaeon ADurb.Bin165]|jgi:hypothetical protein|nr:MAG: hypothetical protein BWY05_01128 [Euryarchaeota archaeon ADurb.Bin165]